MADRQPSLKKLAIDKANATLMIVLGAAAFVSVFCLVASKSLLTQRSYQSGVISKKKIALKQLNSDIDEANKLSNSYQVFESSPENVIGGDSSGQDDRDGDNARIVLDALPSKYDFPALATSLEKLLSNKQFRISSIAGTDDEVTQSAAPSSGTPQPVAMPFTVDITTTAASGATLLQLFERSIRPMQIQKLSITGQTDQLKITLNAKTYFQPEKKLDIKTETKK
jgi:type II secretory pathway pseudopilin PulG